MPTDYKTPGVYIEEIPAFPPSIVEVATAIPAFIGYTELGGSIQRITSLLEYNQYFGGAPSKKYTVDITDDPNAPDPATAQPIVTSVTPAGGDTYFLYYAMCLYFNNGGGPCYISPAGMYADGGTIAPADMQNALDRVAKEEEPTLLVMTDLAGTDTQATLQTLYTAALQQCNDLQDRFVIFDVPQAITTPPPPPPPPATGTTHTKPDEVVDLFRTMVGQQYLNYGAAYTPWLQTAISYEIDDDDVTLTGDSHWLNGLGGNVTYSAKLADGNVTVNLKTARADGKGSQVVVQQGAKLAIEASSTPPLTLTITHQKPSNDSAPWDEIKAAWTALPAENKGKFELVFANWGDKPPTVADATTPLTTPSAGPTLSEAKSNTYLYNLVKAQLAGELVTLPPSSAIAGVYASVDRDRGVWKAPANVSLASVINPTIKITDASQAGLNVDPTTGKSINAIRAFTGKGVLVWGARTLDGNSNDWRYIPVRRLFIMVEESVRRAIAFAVFEPNDNNTWLKVKTMIESFLNSLWKQGGLVGPSAAAAYYVNVGLGKTMTAQDVLEGRMIVEIGMAPARPAEFIILRFTQKLQES